MSKLTYTWKLTSLKKKSTTDVAGAIVQTYWQKIGTDADGNTGTFPGATPFDLNTMDLENFTPFEELTESMVLGWIQAVVVDSYETHVDEKILQQIMAVKQPIVEQNLPWVPEEESTPNVPETEE